MGCETVKFDPPKLTPPREGEAPWTLVEDWFLVYGVVEYHLQAGFETDGASIPRFLWRICGTPLQAPRLYAAMVHDAAYSGKWAMTRKEADKLYRDLLLALGVGSVKAYIEYTALRVCGGAHWQGGEE